MKAPDSRAPFFWGTRNTLPLTHYKTTACEGLEVERQREPLFVENSHLPLNLQHHMADIDSQRAYHFPEDSFPRSVPRQQSNHASHNAGVSISCYDVLQIAHVSVR